MCLLVITLHVFCVGFYMGLNLALYAILPNEKTTLSCRKSNKNGGKSITKKITTRLLKSFLGESKHQLKNIFIFLPKTC